MKVVVEDKVERLRPSFEVEIAETVQFLNKKDHNMVQCFIPCILPISNLTLSILLIASTKETNPSRNARRNVYTWLCCTF
jgi:hypothetical protein